MHGEHDAMNNGDDRVRSIIEGIQRVASGDFSSPITVTGEEDDLDAIATGINMLTEEIAHRDKESNEKQEAILNILEDVNEAKEELEKATVALTESEEKYRDLVENINDVFYATDENGTITYISPIVSHIMDYHPEDIIGRPFMEFIHEDDLERIMEAFTDIVAGNLHPSEYRVMKKDGGYQWVRTSSRPIKDENGKLLGLRGVLSDIQEKKEREERLEKALTDLEKSNKELEQFAYVASHDLQEPLRMVSSYLQLLNRRYGENLDDTAKEFIDFAVDGSTRMSGLIQDLLKFSRVGTKGKPFEPTEMKEVVDTALKNLEIAIQDHEATVSVDEMPVASVDAGQMVQLFQNLIGNAMKFNRPGMAPEVKVGLGGSDTEWEFTIADNGIGIPEDQLERVFVIFQRLHPREEYDGTGIGLAVCKRIVERHGGRIWVESAEGEGSTFHFTIPKRRDE